HRYPEIEGRSAIFGQGDALLEKIIAPGGKPLCVEPFQLILGENTFLTLMRLKQISAIPRRFDFEDGMPEGSANGFDEDRGILPQHFRNRIPIASFAGVGEVGLKAGVLLEQPMYPQFVAVDRRIK